MNQRRGIVFIILCVMLSVIMLAFISCEDMSAKDGFAVIENEVKSIERIATKDGVDIYEITFSDDTTRTIKITSNEIEAVSFTGATVNENGELVLTLSNNTTINAGSVMGPQGIAGAQGATGEKGADGENGIGIEQIQIVNGELIVTYTDNTQSNLGNVTGSQGPKGETGATGATGAQGPQGETGNGIKSITKTESNANIDTYTIIYTDGTTSIFTINNGEKGEQGETGATGATGAQGPQGATGNGIKSVEKTETVGNIDTYTITFTDGSSTTFTVTNGEDGSKGEKGETGAQGAQGPQGEAGVGISEVKVVDGEMIIVYTDNSEENLGIVTSTDWTAVYNEYKASNPNYSKTQAEWMAEIVEKALDVPEYTVTFDSNGGTSVDSQIVKKGDKVAVPSAEPIKNGYKFLGWYVDDEKWSFIGYTITENITLTAKWELTNCEQAGGTHNYGNNGTIISSPNCSSLGISCFTCLVCGYADYREFGSLTDNHQFESGVCTYCGLDIGTSVNVLVTNYSGSVGAPWSQVELGASSFGESIQRAYDERQALILEKYGVTVNWVAATNAQSVASDITTAMTSEDTSYELAYPRATEVQALVSLVYDMSNSEYIDFTKSYYSQSAYESFTVAERTLFTAGDFDFNDEQVAYMLFVNKDMLADYGVDADTLYTAVKNGTWTYDTLKNISKNVSQETGNGTYGDEDVYGFATKDVSRFYHYANIKEADVDPETGLYRIALNLDEGKVYDVINNIIEVNTSTWARTSWGGDWGANASVAFMEERVLFYDDVAQQLDNMGTITFSLGALPFPKLNLEQDDYSVYAAYTQSTLVCIPKCTANRTASEFFVDVLAKTGSDYMMEAYYEKCEAKFNAETAEEDMEILKNYIFANINYDAGNMTSGWSGLLATAKADSYANNVNNFTQALSESLEQAEITISSWNEAWMSYYEDE